VSEVANHKALVHRQLALDSNTGSTALAAVCGIDTGGVHPQRHSLSRRIDGVEALRKSILLVLVPVAVELLA
jgi:hypothetical protein